MSQLPDFSEISRRMGMYRSDEVELFLSSGNSRTVGFGTLVQENGSFSDFGDVILKDSLEADYLKQVTYLRSKSYEYLVTFKEMITPSRIRFEMGSSQELESDDF